MKRIKQGIAVMLCAFALFTLGRVDLQAASLTENNSNIAEEQLLSYLVFGSDYVQISGEQYVLVGIGDGTCPLASATIHYKNYTTGAEYTALADTVDSDSALFYLSFPDKSFTGCYGITAIDYEADGATGTIKISDTGITGRFGVNQAVDADPDAEVVDGIEEQSAAGMVITDSTGESMTADEFGDAVAEASDGISASDAVSATGSGNLVIVLDPGHGGNDSGAAYYGLYEKNLNLAIASYCKAELDTYAGITVYMTRSTDQTLGDGSQSSSLDTRVAIASQYGADVLISFHINASTNGTVNGADVYYPNGSYNAVIGNIGSGLASCIEEKLTALGLKNNGTKIWNSQNNTLYPDGSLADYLGLLRRSKLAGFPCVLIEHAFLSNSGDVSNYLSSAEKLKALGVADATGIAQYYGLTKKSTPQWSYITSSSSTTVKLVWKKVSGASGYKIYRAASKSGSYSKIATVEGADTRTYTDKSLTSGTKYYYKIRAYTSWGDGSYSAIMQAYPLKKTTVTSVKSVGSGKLTVTWKAGSKASGYILYRSTSKNGTYKKITTINSGTKLSYTDKSVDTGKTYYYKIKTLNNQNNKTGYSSASSGVTGWSLAATKITGVASDSAGGLKIKWNTVKNAYQYQVYRSTSQNGTYTRIETVKTNYYVDTSVKDNKQYYYKIRVLNLVNTVKGNSDYSTAKTGMQISKTTISYVQSKSSSSLKLAWTKVSQATGYRIYRSTSKSGTYEPVATKDASTLTYTDTKLTAGQTYYYKVQVLNKVGSYSGVSEYSKVLAGVPANKAVISQVQSISSTQLKISWGAVKGVTGYQIARSTSENGTYAVIKTGILASATSYTDMGLTVGQQYYYKIQTINSNNGKEGYGSYSVVAAGKTVGKATIKTVAATTGTALKIAWTEVSSASGYQIYRSTQQNGTYTQIGEVTSPDTTVYEDIAPEGNTLYYYKVLSLNSNNGVAGYGDFSAPVSGRTNVVETPSEPETETETETESVTETQAGTEAKQGAGAELETETGAETETSTETGTEISTKTKTGTEISTETEVAFAAIFRFISSAKMG